MKAYLTQYYSPIIQMECIIAQTLLAEWKKEEYLLLPHIKLELIM